MTDLRDQLRTYIDGIAEAVAIDESRRAAVVPRRSIRPVTAALLGAAAVLLPVLALYGLGVFSGGPSPTTAPVAAPATAPSTTMTRVTVPPTTTPATTAPTTMPPTVAVPNLIGLPASEAVFLLQELGLRSEPYNVFGEAAAPGIVVDQDPPAGTQVDDGATIGVGVSGIASCESVEPPAPAEGFQLVVVLFGCLGGDGMTPDISYVTHRTVPDGADPLTATIEGLIAGPTQEERDNGYASFFSEISSGGLNGVEFDGTHVTVDFNEAVLVNGSNTSTGMLFYFAELYANVFQYEGIDSVAFHLDGDCEAWSMSFESDGCRTMTRDSWENAFGNTG